MCVYCATECAFYYLHEHSSCTCMHKCTYSVCRVGQSRIYTPYMTVCLVVSLPKRPCIHCTYMIYGFGQPWVRAEMCAFYAFCLSLCFLHFVPSLCFLHVLFVTVLSTRSVCHCAFYTFCLSLCFLHLFARSHMLHGMALACCHTERHGHTLARTPSNCVCTSTE